METQTVIQGRYQILDQLGEGGMGTVFRCHDRLMGQHVALKRVTTPKALLEFSTKASQTHSLDILLAREFQTLASLRHPNIIPVLDYGFDAEQNPFFTMALLDNAVQINDAGEDVSFEQRITYLVQILQALSYLHRRGILHRDLKPGNILVHNNHAYLLDFGLAVEATVAQNSNETVGTLAYMAPEILQGKAPSVASDLYAFGMIAYEMLLGLHPHAAESPTLLIQNILVESVHIPNGVLSSGIEAFLYRLLSKAPDERFDDVTQTLRTLCRASGRSFPSESHALRESYLEAATFVGRTVEQTQLSTAIETNLDGQGSAWLVGGESGVGKSRLVREIRTQALVRGVQVLSGQAIVDDGLPFQLWRAAMPLVLLSVTLSDEEAALLQYLVPDAARILGRELPPLDLEQAITRIPLLIPALLERLTLERPVLLLLEDLQWADADIDLVRSVMTLSLSSRLMVIGTYRNDEKASLPDLLPEASVLPLARLTKTETEQLTRAMLGSNIGQRGGVLDLVQRETEGNAFFIVEVLRTLAEEAGQIDQIGFQTLPGQVFSGGVQLIVERRLGRLPDWSQDAVRFAAVAGRQVDLKLLRTAMPDLEIDAWLDVCVNASVFDQTDGGEWRFAHDKLREGLLATLSKKRLRALHREVAGAIEQTYPDTLPLHAQRLAAHYAAAGDEIREGLYAMMAVEQLLELQQRDAYDLALRSLQLRAYLQVENPTQQLALLYQRLGQLAMRLSNYEESREWLEKSRDLFDSLHNEVSVARINSFIGELGWMTGHFDEGIPLLEASFDILEQAEEWRAAGYAMMTLTAIRGTRGDQDSVLELGQRCLAMMRRTGDKIAIARAMNNLANYYDMSGDPDKSLAMHSEALAIREGIKDKTGIAFSLANMSAINSSQGRLDEAEKLGLRSLQLLREVGNRRSEAFMLSTLGQVAERRDTLNEALNYYELSASLAQQIGDKRMLSQSLGNMGRMEVALDLNPNVLHRYRRMLAISREIEFGSAKLNALENIADYLHGEGQHAEAVRILTVVLQASSDESFEMKLREKLESWRSDLSVSEFEQAQATGAALELEDLIDEMLGGELSEND